MTNLQLPKNIKGYIEELRNNASQDVQDIIKRVLEAEERRLYNNDKGRINDDIIMIVKEVVQ